MSRSSPLCSRPALLPRSLWSTAPTLPLVLGLILAGTGCVGAEDPDSPPIENPPDPQICPPTEDRDVPFIMEGLIFDPRTDLGVADIGIFSCPREPGAEPDVQSRDDGSWFLEVPDRDYIWLEASAQNTWIMRAAFDPRVEGEDKPYRLGVPVDAGIDSINVEGEEVPLFPGTGWLMIDALHVNSLLDIDQASVSISTETTPPFHSSPAGGLEWGNTIIEGFDVIFVNLPPGPVELEVSVEEGACRLPAPFLITEDTVTVISAYCE